MYLAHLVLTRFYTEWARKTHRRKELAKNVTVTNKTNRIVKYWYLFTCPCFKC